MRLLKIDGPSEVHFAREPFKAVCGSDVPNQWTTPVAELTTCPKCLRSLAAAHLDVWLRHWWGERCPDFEPDCPCCKAWAARDFILDQEGDASEGARP